MARPKIEINLRKLQGFMRVSPSLQDTANMFDCSQDTIERVIQENFKCGFAEFRAKNFVNTRMSIKRKMIKKALNGDNTMLIWLSKNMLDMSEKVTSKVESSNVTTVVKLTEEELQKRLDENLKKLKLIG